MEQDFLNKPIPRKNAYLIALLYPLGILSIIGGVIYINRDKLVKFLKTSMINETFKEKPNESYFNTVVKDILKDTFFKKENLISLDSVKIPVEIPGSNSLPKMPGGWNF